MASPANDAHRIQLVRVALSRDVRTRDLPRVNVSSCQHIVTIHGELAPDQARTVCEVAGGVDGVREVVCKI